MVSRSRLDDVLQEDQSQSTIQIVHKRPGKRKTYGNEKIRNPPLILLPGITVLLAAAGNVTPRAVSNHAAEEDGVEPGEGAAEAGDQTPADSKVGVAGIVHLASEAVPAVHQDAVAGLGLDLLRVLDRLPGQLGEGLAGEHLAALLGAEAVLLRVARVPDPVDEQVAHVETDQREPVPPVLVRVVVGQEDGAVAVGERHAGKVPEDQHETPLLVVHVPRRHDQLLALGARVGVQVVRHHQEADLAGHVAVAIPLARCGAQGEQQKDVPRQAHLEEHLEVKDAEHARVELGAHEEVVDVVAGHAVGGAAGKGRDVGDDGHDEARDDGDREQGAELVDDLVQGEDAREVQNTSDGEGRVEGDVGRAVVLEHLAALVGERLAVGGDAGQEAVEGALEDEESPVPQPRLAVGESLGIDEVEQVGEKVTPALAGLAAGDAAVVLGRANPHVPHEDGEEDHHGTGAVRTAKLEVARGVDLGVHAGPPAVDELFLPRLAIEAAAAAAGISVQQRRVLDVGLVRGGVGRCGLHRLLGLVEVLVELAGGLEVAFPEGLVLRLGGLGRNDVLGGRGAGFTVGGFWNLGFAATSVAAHRGLHHALKELLLSVFMEIGCQQSALALGGGLERPR